MKELEFISDRDLDDVLNFTISFWNDQISKSQIIEHVSYEDNRVHVLRITRGWDLFSFGENFKMTFERLLDSPNKTKIHITITLKYGCCAQWFSSSNLLKNWAKQLNLELIDYGTKPFIITWTIMLLALGFMISLFFWAI